MPASGSVSEHDPEGYSGGRSGNKTQDGNAGDGWRASDQQETRTRHAQGPESYSNVHDASYSALPLSPVAPRFTAPWGNLAIV
jgi:hypothetical protein